MLDSYNRKINYLRISVTDRCNLRCRYCMPEEGIQLIRHEDVLSYEEILEITEVAVGYGIDKVRITGGEPLARKNVVALVKMLATINEIRDLSMTTNGTLLRDYSMELKNAGLHRLNISLDTINPAEYKKLTRFGNVIDVFNGIDEAKRVGFDKIKINTVIENSPEEKNAKEVAEYAAKENLEIRFIRKMDLVNGQFWVVQGGKGGDCEICNRLRLSCDGIIRPCLFSDIGFSVKELGIETALLNALKHKPEKGHINKTTTFYGLGG